MKKRSSFIIITHPIFSTVTFQDALFNSQLNAKFSTFDHVLLMSYDDDDDRKPKFVHFYTFISLHTLLLYPVIKGDLHTNFQTRLPLFIMNLIICYESCSKKEYNGTQLLCNFYFSYLYWI